MRHRAGVHARSHQSGDVRHIHKEDRSNRLCYLGDALKFDDARVGARSCDDHLWLVLLRQLFDLVVINAFGVLAHVVFHEFVHAPGEVQRVAVGQMPAVCQSHAQHGVAGLQSGHIHGNIRRGSGMRLHVGVLRAKQLFGAINGQLLNLIGKFAAAVVTLPGISLRVFVGEN